MKSIVICSTLGLIAVIGMAIACAPEFPKAVFVYERHPDFPRTEYLNGKIGIFQPTYARSYLVIAYRYMSGKPLTAMEREQVRDYWKDRESADWDDLKTDWISKWESERVRVPAAVKHGKDPVSQGLYHYDPDGGAFYLNCAEDAYRTAYNTLRSREQQFGVNGVAIRSWRDAQDAVFSNCSDDGTVPAPAAASLPAIIHADRDYQIAAAHFYAGDYVEAEARFRQIADTPTSPWRGIAPYLAVRTMARAAGDDTARLERAEAGARKVLTDPALIPLHGMTRVLLHRVILRERSEDYFHEIARDLTSARQGRSFREELWDYTTLFDNFAGWDPWGTEKKPVDAAIFSRDDLSDWIFTFQQNDGSSGRHALERWRRSRTVPWLIAALRNIKPGSPDADTLIAAASEIEPSQPGYAIANFYRLEWMLDNQRKPEARADLDRMIQLPLPRSTLNLFRSLRMRAAPDLAEFLSFAGRMPVMLTSDGDIGQLPGLYPSDWHPPVLRRAAGKLLLDGDSIKILNERTPMRLLREAALGEDIPPYVKRDFLLTAFTRALLLDDSDDGLKLAAALAASGADPSGYLQNYQSAGSEDDRRFAGIFFILHHPEARPYLASGLGRDERPGQIESYRDNWWCPVDLDVELDARPAMVGHLDTLKRRENPDAPEWSAAFLTAEDRAQASKEFARLAATHSGPDYLIHQTMGYARAHPKDPRIPESLHFALRSQRYGCVREKTKDAAKQAWRYLWRMYPADPWTRKSNYNFESANLPRPRE